MKTRTIVSMFIAIAALIAFQGCGGGGGGGSTCVATASCCGGSGYSNDGGTTCFHDSACTTSCATGAATALKLTNTTSSAITIGFVTAAYGGACPEGQLLTAQALATAGWCTDYEAGVDGAGKCLITLGPAGSSTASTVVPNPNGLCMSGSFGLGGFAGCQTSTYPTGWTQGEYTLNPKATSQEAVDISAVNGVNYALSINLADPAWFYEDGSAIVNQTVGPNGALNDNIGIKGVYPNSCTDCIQLVGSIPCAGLAPVPPTCNTSRICNVFRNSSGGVVEFKVGALLN